MWLFYALPAAVAFVMCVIHASETLDKVRLHWNEYRCNPIYIPFAGAIRPDIGVESNFQHCMNQFAQSIFKFMIDEIMSMFKTVTSSVGEIGGTLVGGRSIFSRMRKVIFSFAAQVFGKIVNSMGSMTYIMIKIRDIMKRFVGEGYIGAFLAQTSMDFIYSFVMLVITIIKIFVFTLLAISFILALFQPELLVLAILLASLIAASGF
jgi:hypothetical protein